MTKTVLCYSMACSQHPFHLFIYLFFLALASGKLNAFGKQFHKYWWSPTGTLASTQVRTAKHIHGRIPTHVSFSLSLPLSPALLFHYNILRAVQCCTGGKGEHCLNGGYYSNRTAPGCKLNFFTV